MKDSKPLYRALIMAIILATLHFLAVKFYFYWTLWWYDVIQHYLAGLIGGFAVYGTIFSSGVLLSRSRRESFIVSTIFVIMLIAGVIWEIFEYTHGLTYSHEGYARDTMNDLILDCTGALSAAIISLKERHG